MTQVHESDATAKPAPDLAFGRAVHMAMYRKGITQKRLAEHLGCHQTALSKKLHGQRPWTLAELITVADFLREDARDLLVAMWGEPGEPTAASRRNNPCYYDAKVRIGPWPDPQTSRAA